MVEAVALRVLAALIAGLRPDVTTHLGPDWPALVRAGRFHGVLSLIHARWLADALARATSETFAAACADEARAAAALDLAQRVVTRELLGRLDAAGVRPLLLKGAALAHTHYVSSALRPRSDVDLLIAESDRQRCGMVFSAMGYARAMQLPGHYVSSQETWLPAERRGLSIDLHWRVNNSPVLATLLGYGELAMTSVPIPALAPSARCPDPAHALLLAALHREGSRDAPFHHVGWSICGGDRLIWLVDFALLIRLADAAQRRSMLELVRAKGAQPLMAAAARALQQRLPAFALHEISELNAMAGIGEGNRQLQRYLSASPWLRRCLDWAALGSWHARLSYVREQLYPPADYLRARDPRVPEAGRLTLALRRMLRR